jgi:hypothetical protein
LRFVPRSSAALCYRGYEPGLPWTSVGETPNPARPQASHSVRTVTLMGCLLLASGHGAVAQQPVPDHVPPSEANVRLPHGIFDARNIALSVAKYAGQQGAAGHGRPPQVSIPPPHRFFDAKNIALTVAESIALTADGIYIQRILTQWGGEELDPIARPFVNAGWPGQIAGGALVVGAEVVLRYLLHRSNHHTLERLLPTVLIVYGTVGAVHNARLLHDLQRGRACVQLPRPAF